MKVCSIYAGPNGSGKTTFNQTLDESAVGKTINADEIEARLKIDGGLELSQYRIEGDIQMLLRFFRLSTLLKKAGITIGSRQVCIEGNRLSFSETPLNSYVASVVADFIRHESLALDVPFGFETVMSHHDKVAFMKKARQRGFVVTLYFIATEHPDINIERVKQRVLKGGHDVPIDKIIDRYYKSIALLPDAILACDEAVLFDNSGKERIVIGEKRRSQDLQLAIENTPKWLPDVLRPQR